MANYFVVSDVHSFYGHMIKSLTDQGFDINNKNHVFVSLGDLLDRGPEAKNCLDFVNNLPKERKILIKGNHEDLMQEAIERGYFLSHDYHNGTMNTVEQIVGLKKSPQQQLLAFSQDASWNKYYNSLIDYYENDKYVFVHGWIPCLQWDEGRNLFGEKISYYDPVVDWRHSSTTMWKKARWLNGMDCWNNNIKVTNKTVLCGHIHSSWGHCFLHNDGVNLPKQLTDLINWNTDPFIDDSIICLDACTTISYKINCIKLTKQKKFNKNWRTNYS